MVKKSYKRPSGFLVYIGIFTLFISANVKAQESNADIDVKQIRNELARNKDSITPAQNQKNNTFQSVSDESLEAKRRQLLAKEAELLKALEAGSETAEQPAAPHAAVTTKPLTAPQNGTKSPHNSNLEVVKSTTAENSTLYTAKGDAIQPPLNEVKPEIEKPSTTASRLSEIEEKEIEEAVATEPAKAKLSPSEIRKIESKTEADLRDEVAELKRQLSTKSLTSSASQRLVGTLEQDNVKWKRRNQELVKELDETRNRLLMAEKQVERLSEVVQRRQSCELAQLNKAPGTPPSVATTVPNLPTVTYAPKKVAASESKGVGDMPIAVVTADKALLRSGPGRDNSPITSVSKGTRLVVESNQGQWYRVYAPNGSTAWVSADVLQFIATDVPPGSKSFIKIRPIDPNF